MSNTYVTGVLYYLISYSIITTRNWWLDRITHHKTPRISNCVSRKALYLKTSKPTEHSLGARNIVWK